MVAVALVGTLDTKGTEYAFVADRLRALGVEVVMIDCGILGPPPHPPDIDRAEVAAAAGADIEQLAAAGDRGAAVQAMSRGAGVVLERLVAEGRIGGALAMGGTGGTSLASAAFRRLPLGLPKLIVSTAASGDTHAYIGESDLILVPSIVDVSGLNRISTKIMGNAAAAMAGMVGAPPTPEPADAKPLVGASIFGVTTPCVTRARERLEGLGYEVLVFHMTGAGGRTLESLITAGMLVGVFDVTTTELADELVGGVFDAGPDRLRAAARTGIPAVVSVGALDMVNWGPPDTIPERFADRLTYEHNATTTLMRTPPEECAELGRQIARKLSAATGPVALFIPRGGVSAIATEGGVFHDPAADAALIDTLLAELGDDVEVHDLEYDINDERFSAAMANRLAEMVAEARG